MRGTREALGMELQLDFYDSDQNGLLEYLSEESNIDLLLVSELQEQVQKNILLPLDELLREEGKDILRCDCTGIYGTWKSRRQTIRNSLKQGYGFRIRRQYEKRSG